MSVVASTTMADEFVAAGNLNQGDIIRITHERGEFRVRRIVKGHEVECFGPLGAVYDHVKDVTHRGTGGTKRAGKIRTFDEERVAHVIRTAAEDEETRR